MQKLTEAQITKNQASGKKLDENGYIIVAQNAPVQIQATLYKVEDANAKKD